jgi:hypothetical protein
MLKSDEKSKVTEGLHLSAEIIREIGNFVLSNGKKISDILIVEGVSIWFVAQPDMVLHVLPPVLFKIDKNNSYNNYSIKTFLKSTKYSVNEFSKIFSGFYDFKRKNINIEYWFLLSNSSYIYRDTLMALQTEIESTKSELINTESYGSLFRKENTLNFLSSEWRKNFSKYIHYKIKIRRASHDFFKHDFKALSMHFNSVPSQSLKLLFLWFFQVFAQRNIVNCINAKKCLGIIKPSKIVSGDVADPLNRIYSHIAIDSKIPVIEIQFGIYDSTSLEWRFCISDKIVVWGEYFRELFENEYLIPKSKIVVLGSPRFDYLLNKKKDVYFNENTKPKKILFASMYSAISNYDNSYDVKLIDNFKLMVVKVASKFENIVLYIKPHPLESIDWITNNNLENVVIIDKQNDIREYIPKVDAFITFGSTSTFDALLNDNIVLLANTPNLVWWDDIFLKYNAAINIHSEHELQKVMDNILNNSPELISESRIKSNQFLNDKLQVGNTSASSRIVDFIKMI